MGNGWESRSVRQLYEVVIRTANESSGVREALERGLEHVSRATAWPLGHAMLVRPWGLEPSRIWFARDAERFETFRRITEQVRFEFGQGTGPLRRTATSGEPTWIIDVTTQADYQRARLAEDIGVRGAAVIPVLVGDECVAVLEFYSPDPIEPDRDLLEVMRHVGMQLGRVFERERVRDAERRTLEAERRYLGMAAHEITNPLATAGAALNLLREGDIRADEADDLLDAAARAVETLRSITRNFLVDARLRGGRIQAQTEEFPAEEAVLEALADVRALAGRSEVRCEPGLEVRADRFLLRQALVNLLTNAQRYGEPPFIVEATRNEGWTEIAVTDHGPGVPEEFEPRLFERFSRGGRAGEGSGLGLDIVAHLVSIQDGHVRHVPNEPSGATFVLSLPAAGH